MELKNKRKNITIDKKLIIIVDDAKAQAQSTILRLRRGISEYLRYVGMPGRCHLIKERYQAQCMRQKHTHTRGINEHRCGLKSVKCSPRQI